MDTIEKLAELFAAGFISDDEYERRKSAIAPSEAPVLKEQRNARYEEPKVEEIDTFMEPPSVEPSFEVGEAEEAEVEFGNVPGYDMEKLTTSHSVINIIPPRDLWGPIQSLRTRYVAEQRCGPHFSFIDPFVAPQYIPAAARLLRKELAFFRPFTVKLNRFDMFRHKKSCTVYVGPQIEPATAIDDLIERILRVFPQCDDQLKKAEKSGGGRRYVAHMTVATFKNEKEARAAMAELAKTWVPVEFVVKEIYLLHRLGGDPFEVKEVVALGPKELREPSDRPHFGKNSVSPSDEGQLTRSVVVAGLAGERVSSDAELKELLVRRGFNASAAEVARNPDGKLRSCGVVEFSSRKEAERAAAEFGGNASGPYARWLPTMVFPGTIGDCCSWKGVMGK